MFETWVDLIFDFHLVASVGPSLSFMVNELLTLNFKIVKRSKNKRKFILCTKCKVQLCISGFNLLGENVLWYFFLTKKCFGKKEKEKRETRRKEKKTNKKRERKRITGLFQFSKSNLSKSKSILHIFNSLVITHTTLNFISGQFCSSSVHAQTCFWQNAKRLPRLQTGIFHTLRSGGL